VNRTRNIECALKSFSVEKALRLLTLFFSNTFFYSFCNSSWIHHIAILIPRAIRDTVYKTVAATRYSIFGVEELCRKASAEDELWFL